MATSDAAGPWALFLGGKWTKIRPRRPGYYPVATLEGHVLAPEKWKTIGDGGQQEGVRFGEPGWLGYWWSQPIPPLSRGPRK
jgi:hypothetical protein